jgi:hypothetical protein
MAVIGRSAMGREVNFDILKIRQQLASKPVNIGVDDRRQFIDTKNGVKPKEVTQKVAQNALKVLSTDESDINDALALSMNAVHVSLEAE